MTSGTNYAKDNGISSLAAPIIFTIIYAPLLAFYVVQGLRRRTYVYFILTLFCLMRVVSFALRAALAGSTAAATNENAFIAYEVIYNIGFFGVLYSTYTLAIDREAMVDMGSVLSYLPGPALLVFSLMRRRMLIRIALLVAVALGIVGITDIIDSKSQSKVNEGTTLRSASLYIFLAVACMIPIHALLLSAATVRTYSKSASAGGPPPYEYRPGGPVGERHGIPIIFVMSLLLVAREAFYAATVHNTHQQTNEHLWYPLSALTELIVICLFAVPGLIPAYDQLPQEARQLNLLA